LLGSLTGLASIAVVGFSCCFVIGWVLDC